MGSKKKLKAPPAAQHAGKAERIDAALAHAAAKHRDRPAVRAAAFVAEIADQPPLITVCVATAAAGAVLGKPRLLRAGLRMLASELLATGVKSVVKRYVARTRPNKMLEDGRYALHADVEGEKREGPWSSFPSGHTAGAVAVARAFTREYPEAAPAMAAAATFVGLVQPVSGAHFPSDVAVGGVVGFASEGLVNAAANAVRR